MPLVTSLLTAIVRANGDALVLHAGERPYVVAPTGQSELASRALTLDAMKGMLNELLPVDARRALDELGAVQHDLGSPSFAPGQRFSVVAARGGDDIWIEIRRHRNLGATGAAGAMGATGESGAMGAMGAIGAIGAESAIDSPAEGMGEVGATAEAPEPVPEPVVQPEPESYAAAAAEVEQEPQATYELESELESETVLQLEPATWSLELGTLGSAPQSGPVIEQIHDVEQETYDIGTTAEVHEITLDVSSIVDRPTSIVEAPTTPTVAHREPADDSRLPTMDDSRPPAVVDNGSASMNDGRSTIDDVPRPAVVLPLARHQVRGDQTARLTPSLATGIDRLLRIAAARGASTLYLTSQARPSIRVDGEISPIDGESALSEGDVETLILDIMPERNREALRSHAGTEWICDVPDVGRIRCVTFRDHRGAGGIFRMIPARGISAEQLGLSREIQGLCAESDGLVLVAGQRSSGKSTLISAFVDLINRTRSEYVITIENQIKFVHENRGSLISQREVRGDRTELVSVARAALRENPDVLVVEDFGAPEMVTLALEAALSGHLVVGAMTAHTATDAVDRIIDQTPPERRAKVQLGLAESLRGIVTQVLLRKTGGGRVAAREVLLNTRAVANLIAEGKTSQLPMAIDSGRKHGMVALNDALVAFVQGGIVDSREAYRQAADQQGFLALLKRHGIDTSFVERLA